ncbi:uncharacterized protein LOC117074480 [Trachypithecus francoisi]|uniref:uncharacterized protein LOC117074480 n=1 Tax=Trachypithecus francoisi TaxID=54180 RepID=UPI00141BADEE|nr:uncharacterized protein LOC117074480 [Trachypithecus francoisi]
MVAKDESQTPTNSRHVPSLRSAAKGREQERGSPSFYFEFLFVCFKILMDDKTTRICHLLAKRKLPPPTPSSMPGHFWGQSDVAGVGMPKMELGRMTQSGRRGPVLQVSALAGVEPHNFASFALCLSLL